MATKSSSQRANIGTPALGDAHSTSLRTRKLEQVVDSICQNEFYR